MEEHGIFLILVNVGNNSPWSIVARVVLLKAQRAIIRDRGYSARPFDSASCLGGML